MSGHLNCFFCFVTSNIFIKAYFQVVQLIPDLTLEIIAYLYKNLICYISVHLN